MGTAGRKPVPGDLHKARGNPSKKPLKDLDDIKAPELEKLPDPPIYLGSYGAKEWVRVGPILWEMGLLTGADLLSFEAYCMNVHLMIEAAQDIEENGFVIWGTRGKVKNPATTTFAAAVSAMRQLASEFGMTPSSRARIKLPGDDGESLDDLLGSNDEDLEPN